MGENIMKIDYESIIHYFENTTNEDDDVIATKYSCVLKSMKESQDI